MSTSLHIPSSDSATPTATAVAAPGWYQDPATPGQQRYWDGAAWTKQVRQSATQAAPTSVNAGASGGMVFAGWLCAFLFPIGGVILALVIRNADKGTGRARGAWILGVSIAVVVLSVILIAAAASTHTSTSPGY